MDKFKFFDAEHKFLIIIESKILLEKSFDSSLPTFLSAFLKDKKLTQEEAMQIKKMIEEATK